MPDMDIALAILTSLLTGAVTATVTVISMRTDIVWIKRMLFDHDGRIINLERKKS